METQKVLTISNTSTRLEAFSGMYISHSFSYRLDARSFKCVKISLTNQTTGPGTLSKVSVLGFDLSEISTCLKLLSIQSPIYKKMSDLYTFLKMSLT